MTTSKKQPKFAILIFPAALSVLPSNMFLPSLPHIADALSSNYAAAKRHKTDRVDTGENLVCPGFELINLELEPTRSTLAARRTQADLASPNSSGCGRRSPQGLLAGRKVEGGRLVRM